MKPSTLRKVPSLNYWMPLVEDEEQVVCRIKLLLIQEFKVTGLKICPVWKCSEGFKNIISSCSSHFVEIFNFLSGTKIQKGKGRGWVSDKYYSFTIKVFSGSHATGAD